jgi:hypothetical protein
MSCNLGPRNLRNLPELIKKCSCYKRNVNSEGYKQLAGWDGGYSTGTPATIENKMGAVIASCFHSTGTPATSENKIGAVIVSCFHSTGTPATIENKMGAVIASCFHSTGTPATSENKMGAVIASCFHSTGTPATCEYLLSGPRTGAPSSNQLADWLASGKAKSSNQSICLDVEYVDDYCCVFVGRPLWRGVWPVDCQSESTVFNRLSVLI